MFVTKDGAIQLIDDATLDYWNDLGWTEYEGSPTGDTAAATTYDNTTSGLTATDVQAALDEVVTRIVALETP